MELALGENGSLLWNGFRFGSDSIITSFRYKRQRALLEQVAESMDDYRGFVEDFLLKDLVSEDYSVVRFWDEWKNFSDNPIPQTVEGYLEFLKREVEFVGRRNGRIQKMMV